MTPRVLIVEDEAPLLSLYELILTNREVGGIYDVLTADSAEAALAIAAREPFDILLTDYHMPGRDGIELLQEIRRARPATQCLLISGFVDASLVRRALEAGARACLKKPCSMRDILQAVGDAAGALGLATEAGSLPGDSLTASRIGEVIEANLLHTFFIDSDYRIRCANAPFRQEYGPCEGQRCHEVLGGSQTPCPGCQAVAAVDARTAKTVTRPARSPHGDVWEIEERIEPWLGPGGGAHGLVVSFSPLLSLDPLRPAEGADSRRRRIFGSGEETPKPAPQAAAARPVSELRARAALAWVAPVQAPAVLASAVARLLDARAADPADAPRAMRQLAGELRTFARSPEPAACPLDDLNAAVSAVLALAHGALGGAGLEIASDLAVDLPRTRFARALVEQAFLDLVLAIASAKSGGHGRLTVRTYAGNGSVCLGLGLAGCSLAPQAPREGVAPAGGSPLFGGTEGLTLAVIRELLARQHATLDLAPPHGPAAGDDGSRPCDLATIRIPLAPREGAAP